MSFPIRIDQLNFSYDKDPILQDINLSISKGEFVSIIGPNGSGKTTLLKHISRLLSPKAKTVFINDEDIKLYKALDLAKINALVPQESHFEYGFSAFDVVMMGRHPHLKGFQGETLKDIELVDSAMVQTDTLKFRERSISSLSGGERQRVILARAIAQDAEVLLLDEPITFLDIHHQIDIISLMKNHGRQANKTVVAVLHDLNFALRFSDRVVLLHQGKVLSIGKPEQVLTQSNLKIAYGIDVELIYRQGRLMHIMPLF